MEVINPFNNEQVSLPDEIRSELARMAIREAYLMELLEHYEGTGDISTDI